MEKMKTIEEAKEEAKNLAILANKSKLEQEGFSLSAEEYNSLGSTYKLYALALVCQLTHNQLKTTLNAIDVQL